jgi:hypothetical protein
MSADTHPCPYCMTAIPRQALRCVGCGGELRYCKGCGNNVGLASKQKFVGFARGGMKTQYRCMTCNRVLDGPRF